MKVRDEDTYPYSSLRLSLLHFPPQSISLTRKYRLVCNYEVMLPTAVCHSQQVPTPAIIYSLLFLHKKYTVIRYWSHSRCDELNKMPPNFFLCCTQFRLACINHDLNTNFKGSVFFSSVFHSSLPLPWTYIHTASPWKSNKLHTTFLHLQWVLGCISLLVHVSPAPSYLLFPWLPDLSHAGHAHAPVVCVHCHVVPPPPPPHSHPPRLFLSSASLKCTWINSWFLSIACSSAECLITRCR